MQRQIPRVAASASRGLLRRPLRPPPLVVRTYATQVPSTTPQKPLMMPNDMPREDYASPAMYTFSYLSRIVRYLVISGVSLGLVAYAGFEGSHWYIEHVALAAPSRSQGDDAYGWQEEHQGWTGGKSGGTDSRLGWKGRHALRGAWLCQELGAGASPGSIGSSSFHGEAHAAKGLIGAGQGNVNKVDRGYELADEYLDVAIKQAENANIAFPSTLSVVRLPGPPRDSGDAKGVAADPTAIDLLLLKAGIQERIATSEARSRAQDLYERVLVNLHRTAASDGNQAKIIRLATKVGDLSARRGDTVGAKEWWTWGLEQAGIVTPPESVMRETEVPVKRGWFSSKPVETTSTGIDVRAPLPPAAQALAPPVLRATTSLLISLAAHHATASSLPTAQSLQSLALSLLPSSLKSPESTDTARLHYTWLQSRQALLSLHLASVLYAQDRTAAAPAALQLLETAVNASEGIVEHPPSTKLPAVKQLLVDITKTSAEAHYTRAIITEKSALGANSRDVLEGVLEDLERAQALVAVEGEGEGRGAEWQRYFKAAVRVRSKMGLGEAQP